MVLLLLEMMVSRTGTFEAGVLAKRTIPTRVMPVITTPTRSRVPITSETA
jgi:hypothetical protein